MLFFIYPQYKTARSSELKEILAKQRNKVEVETDATAKVQKVEKDFEFLNDYDKSGYQTDSGKILIFHSYYNMKGAKVLV